MPCNLKSSLVVVVAEGVAGAAVEVAVQVPRAPVEGFPPRPRVRARPAQARVPGPAQGVARRLLRGLQARPRAQRPGPAPQAHQQGKPPEPDSDRVLPEVRQKALPGAARPPVS